MRKGLSVSVSTFPGFKAHGGVFAEARCALASEAVGYGCQRRASILLRCTTPVKAWQMAECSGQFLGSSERAQPAQR